MRVVCLNAWGGKQFKPLAKYVRELAPHTDIFCFQEIFSSAHETSKNGEYQFDLLAQLSALLADFHPVYSPMLSAAALSGGFGTTSGNAIFVRKRIPLAAQGDFFAFGKMYEYKYLKPQEVGFVNYVRVMHDGKPLTVCNVHGIALWPKLDSPARLEQSARILDFVARESNPCIVCGDFNLDPNSQSIAMLQNRMRDLVKESGVQTTRSELHYEAFGRGPEVDAISDYLFVTANVPVRAFEVPDVAVSDHLPLVLDL